MRTVSLRPLLAAMALFMAVTGAITLAVFSGGEPPAGAATRWTIEVNATGFNPRQCNIVRNDEVVFKNTGSTAIRVYKPGHGGLPSQFDETLAPNETSSPLAYTSGASDEFFNDFGDSVTVHTPFTGTGTPGCFKEAPTPTPTPTFTATPIRTATPTATPTPQRPANCTWNGCAVSVGVASDGE